MLKRVLRILTVTAFLATIAMAGMGIVFFLYGRGLSEYDHLKTYEAPVLSRLYATDGQLVSEYAIEKRLFVPFHLIPEQVKLAFIAAEDKNFFYHFGVDVVSTLRALLINTLSNGWQHRPGGASTITQQVAKNFLVGNERSMTRKIKEAIMAFRLEEALPKERIFELYLNQIYLGAGAYGVAAAALIYFDKELDDLSLDEVAFLAALPKAPTALINKQELQRTVHRRNWVIDRMAHLGIVKPRQAELAKTKELQFRTHREYPVQAAYFSSEVRRELHHKFAVKTINAGGFTVKTTLDPKLQQLADNALQQGLIDYDRRYGWRGPHTKLTPTDLKNWQEKLKALPHVPGMKHWQFAVVLAGNDQEIELGLPSGKKGVLTSESLAWAHTLAKSIQQPNPLQVGDVVLVDKTEAGNYILQQIPEVSGAIVVMDPHTGRVLAMSGGYDFEMNQFNCATQAKRQPGSAFKPFVYLAGLERGLTPETKILDRPIHINLGGDRGFYSPRNYTRKYYGSCALRVGLEQSRNVMTIRLAQRIGMTKIIKIAKDFGIQEQMPRQLAMVLGAGETTVLQLTAAYGMLANGGYKITPRLIDSVQDRYGNTLLDNTQKNKGELVVNPENIQQLTSMLLGVVARGTAKKLQSLGFPVAGKTGTTNDYKDTWFVGYTDDLVIGVFVGFLAPKSLGDKETGSKVTVPIFENFAKNAYADLPKPEFKAVLGKENGTPFVRGSADSPLKSDKLGESIPTVVQKTGV
ncbi:penicillin-binding protein 1A [Candidatus Paracaedibacter symbiosus]|uniref:penicillin-binding protein 1A n=1 Tax=Candidatus Paracaedibacter symbiosus TaxID=244582 RepID=UPI000AB6DE20|nr:PBP1A family penicillin-binding protein [Candidatus Paracaedibacter symbiosus]